MSPVETPTISHSAVIAGLLRPGAYPHPATNIQLKETHLSWVVLAGDYVYKLKKPIDVGFADFRTFEQRATNAEAELSLNRRLAPGTYLGLADIVERNGEVHVRGTGNLLEQAVVMKRLPEDGMLRGLLGQGRVRPTTMDRIARILARFHANAATGGGVDEWGGIENLRRLWAENLQQVKPFIGRTVSGSSFEGVESAIEHFLDTNRAMLDRRVAEGRVRDGHGDLHTDSICVVGRRIVIFDCLEFDVRYRCLDVAAEVAFLSMDLDALGRADLGWRFASSYVEESGDHDLNRVLDFYKCYRAFVRGKVRSLRLDQADDSERSSIHQEAESYFQLAAAYAGGLPRRSLVVLCGLPASGKSTLASALSRRLGMVQVNTDVVRKQTAGQLPTAPQAAEFNAGLYTERMTRATYSLLNRRARRWLRREVPVVLDGTFSTRALRRRAAQVARRGGAALTLVYTSCDERATHQRLQARSASPSVSDADFDVYTRMRQVFEPPDEVSDPELVTDPTGGQNASSIAERLLERGFTGNEGSGQ